MARAPPGSARSSRTACRSSRAPARSAPSRPAGSTARATARAHCRKYPAGTECKPGTCNGAAVSDVNVCDGQGRLPGGSRDDLRPVQLRSRDEQVRVDVQVQHRLRQRHPVRERQLRPETQRRRVRQVDSECKSTFCADGVCCNVACKGPCVSCDQQGRGGTCWPTDVGSPDPHGVCAYRRRRPAAPRAPATASAAARASRPRSVCTAPACSGDRLITGRNLRRPGQLPAARDDGLHALPVRRRRLHQSLRERQRLRRGPGVPERKLRQEVERPALHGRG